jgi:TonB family protein
MDTVTQILIDRSREAEKISRIVFVSFIIHVTALAAIAYAPRHWLVTRNDGPIMTISLGEGAPGPIQGRNPISAKPVQEAVPNAVKPKVEAPPALAKPEMVEPSKAARPQPKAAAKSDTSKTLPQLHGRTPTTGPQVKTGTARVETRGAQVPFGGFGTGGGGGAGAAYTTDVQNFCCPEYLITMSQLVQKNWNPNQAQSGSVVVKFTILRDGRITAVEVEQPGPQFLNLASERAVAATRQLPPLPAQFTGDHLTVHLVFQYR